MSSAVVEQPLVSPDIGTLELLEFVGPHMTEHLYWNMDISLDMMKEEKTIVREMEDLVLLLACGTGHYFVILRHAGDIGATARSKGKFPACVWVR